MTNYAIQKQKIIGMEERVRLQVELQRYLRAEDQFARASKEFNDSCRSLRNALGTRQRFVVQVDFQFYLMTSDNDGNFEVEKVPTL